MAECILMKGGGGADLDAVTAAAGDVLEGKVIVGADGEPLTGSMADNSGDVLPASASLDAVNERVELTVPAAGKYSLTSKLYAAFQTIASLVGLTAEKLVSGNTVLGIDGSATSDATLSSASQLRNGIVGYGKNGAKYTGSMTEKAAATYTPGTANQTIAAGQYLAGAQTIKGDANLKAAYIKKGVSIFGVTGTWEGYVATAVDIYKYGVIQYGLTKKTGTVTFNSNSLYITPQTNGTILYTTNSINLTAYTGIKIKYKADAATSYLAARIYFGTNSSDAGTLSSDKTAIGSTASEATVNIPFTASHALTTTLGFYIGKTSSTANTVKVTVYQISLY